MKAPDPNIDVRLALDEMRLNMHQSLQAGDAIDQKLNLVLVASGAILGLVSILQATLTPGRSDAYWIVFLFAVGLYVICVLLALVAARPQRYRLPIAPEWDELNRVLFQRSEREGILTLLSGYVDQIRNNRAINLGKARLYLFSLGILPITVALLVCLLFMP